MPDEKLLEFLREAKPLDRQDLSPYFEDPDKCLQAVFLDAYAHQAVESILGLPPREIARRTRRCFPKTLEKCLNAIIRKATR